MTQFYGSLDVDAKTKLCDPSRVEGNVGDNPRLTEVDTLVQMSDYILKKMDEKLDLLERVLEKLESRLRDLELKT